MEEEKKAATSNESIGLSQREFLTLFLLHSLSNKSNYPRAIHEELTLLFPGKVHSYDYLCKIAKQLVKTGQLLLFTSNGRNYYQITEQGKGLYSWYQENYFNRFNEVKLVIDRFVHDLTGSGPNPAVINDLPEEYRTYFSKIVSVKDLVRYVTMKMAFSKRPIYMGEVAEVLKSKFGWIASNGYLYDLAHEMEEGGLIVGHWESEKRTKRYLRITDEGQHHFKQIADSASHQVKETQNYLASILSFLMNEG